MTKAEKIYEAIGSGYGFNGSKESAISIIENIINEKIKTMITKTQIGLPVQFMQWDDDCWIVWPAVIMGLSRAKVHVLVLSEMPHVERNVRFVTFKKSGLDYWQFIPEPGR